MSAATLILLLAACSTETAQFGETGEALPTEGPTATALPTPTPEPTATATSTPEPTVEPTLPGAPEARFDQLERDDVVIVVTDNLVVRSAPEVSDDSEIFDVLLQPGNKVWYVDGPRRGSGYEWIQGEVVSRGAPDGRLTGWIATGDNDSDAMWLAVPRDEGNGWRLLGTGRDGMPFSVGVALSQAEYEAEWAEAGASGTPPDVNFDSEMVVRFTHAVPSTCPDMEFHGIGIDTDAGIVYSAGSEPMIPEGATACTTDATPYAFIVAIEREIVPSGEVHFRLERGFIACPDCGRDGEQVTIELP